MSTPVEMGKGHFVRTVRIEWNDVPAEVRGALEPHLNAAAYVLPTWCTEYNIFFSEENSTGNGDAVLSTTVRDDYRFVSLWVHPGFFNYDPNSRYRLVVHELSHALTRPLDALCESLIETVPEGPVRDLMGAQHRRTMEGVVQDVAEAFLRVMPYAG